MMLDFQDKIVVITGAARGIGQAISIELAAAGAHVVLADIQLEPQEKTVSELQSRGQKACAYQCDVTSDESVKTFASNVLKNVGVPDIVYNNAAFIRSGGILNASVENIRRELDVNVLGYIRVAQAFLPDMVARGSGWIVNTASPNAFVPPPMVAGNLLGYCITKGADVSMSQCMATSLKPTGVGVSVVFPDLTYTESVHELTGTAPSEFNTGFAEFVSTQSRPASVVAKRIVNGLREGKYFVNTYDGFEEMLRAWAKNDMDPDFNYLSFSRL
ncbi:hypothetical protein FALCPG4_005718 [Fusarium falciforme]